MISSASPSLIPAQIAQSQQFGTGFIESQRMHPNQPVPGGAPSTSANSFSTTVNTATSLTAAGPQNLKALLPTVPPQCGPPTVSLALLLEFAIKRTMHELEVLADMLQKKKPVDRKISVVEYAHNTRLIFVRLLAIVRWMKTNKKFEPLSSIRFLLDEQATRYVETADKLVEVARNELPNARLPIFLVPQAVEVLTLGTYPRLPQNIKDCFVSQPPLVGREQRLTLRQLNRILEFHLAQSTRQLSPRFEQISIRNGMATLTVPNEFEISLTRLGDDPEQTKWCLLNINILVKNAEVGQGQRLVHPLQVNFIHQLVQERLDNGEKPLLDAYNLLHAFCRSIQLDVLYCQATIIAKMSPLYIRVEEYNVKNCRLVIAYWLQQKEVGGGGAQKRVAFSTASKHTSNYRLIIYCDKTAINSTLRVKHHPPGAELPKIEHGSFSFQRLLNETILFRCRERLLQTQKLLEQAKPKPEKISHTGHSLLSLSCSLIMQDECHPDEALIISADTFFGTVNCRIGVLGGKRNEITELEKQLNADSPTAMRIGRLLQRLRILLLMERLQRAIVSLQVRKISDKQAIPFASKLLSLPADRHVFQFIREDQFYLIIAFSPDEQMGVKIQFYLFSSVESRLTMLDLDADQIIRAAPLPRLYAASTISENFSKKSAEIFAEQKKRHNQRLSEFFQRYRRRQNQH